ncbi:hypothetical protein [Spiroplasma endosymbiont of Apeira syringaria]|uniref:hypothetical protein n=1 Tax=Spiroplasma endosymbiont of Apeira syringaria TaxID=3066307 RepID=UPI0030D25B07
MKLNEFNNAFQTEQQCLAYIANLKENKCIRCFNFNGLLPTCTCGGNNETEWIQKCFSNWTAMSCIYSKFERKQMY